MIFVRFAAEVDEVLAHLDGGLRDLGQIAVFKTKARRADGLYHFGVQQRVAANPLKFGQDARAVQRDPMRAPHFEQEIEKPTTSSSCAIILMRRGSAITMMLSTVNLIS